MRKILLFIPVLAVSLAACSGSSSHASASVGNGKPNGTHSLVGTFKITAGTCSSATATPSGSYLQMEGNGGAVVKNSFGGCANANYTPLKPGTKGGLVTGSYEPNPTPAFSGAKALADQIIQPASFFGSAFALSSQAVDPQTSTHVPPPSVTSDNGQLSGNLAALDVAYNSAYFNQGAPKPDGTYPGTTKALSGTISCGGTFSMQWQSLIVGGAFNNYTGIWHLSGIFVPASGTVAHALGC
ncbi:MAG: hypothetical protein ACYCV7_13305 [Acidimicrobiales bacterium]